MLHLYTVGSAGFSNEAASKGRLAAGQLADLAVLSADYFSIPKIDIKPLESVLTLVGGKVVYAAQEFRPLDPPALPVLVAGRQIRRLWGTIGAAACRTPATAPAVYGASLSPRRAQARRLGRLHVLSILRLRTFGDDDS